MLDGSQPTNLQPPTHVNLGGMYLVCTDRFGSFARARSRHFYNTTKKSVIVSVVLCMIINNKI